MRVNTPLKKFPYALLAIAAIIGSIFLVYRLSRSPISSLRTSNAAPLPDIPAPSGWKADRQGFDRIIFTRQGTSTFTHWIDADAFKMTGTLEDNIRENYPNYPFDASSSLGWATFNGNLVLVSIDRESDAGTAINYALFHSSTIYMFSMLYQFYNPSKQAWIVQNPQDVQSLRAMVQDFAKTL